MSILKHYHIKINYFKKMLITLIDKRNTILNDVKKIKEQGTNFQNIKY